MFWIYTLTFTLTAATFKTKAIKPHVTFYRNRNIQLTVFMIEK